MWSSGLRRACGAARLRQLPTLRQFPTLVHARSYACQKLEEQISIKGRLRPVTAMEDARRTFWRSGWLPAQVHGDKLGPVYLSVPFNEYMSMARKPHIQRKLLRINVEDEGGTPTGESLQVLTDEVFNKLPISSKWNGDYDYITFRRWPRSPPLKMKIPLWVLNEDKCPKVGAKNEHAPLPPPVSGWPAYLARPPVRFQSTVRPDGVSLSSPLLPAHHAPRPAMCTRARAFWEPSNALSPYRPRRSRPAVIRTSSSLPGCRAS
eukprot:3885225-Prymnesium_polylepis.1